MWPIDGPRQCRALGLQNMVPKTVKYSTVCDTYFSETESEPVYSTLHMNAFMTRFSHAIIANGI